MLGTIKRSLDLDMGFFYWFDHITFASLMFLLLAVFIVRTKSIYDWLIIPMWVVISLQLCSPLIPTTYTPEVHITTDTRQWEVLLLIATFSLIIKTKFNAEKVLLWLSRIIVTLGFIALFFNNRRVSGIIPNKSMNAILTAGILIYCDSLLFFILGSIVVFKSQSSTAFLSYLTMFFGSFLTTNNFKKIFFMSICTGALLIALVPDILFSGHRFESYSFYFLDFSLKDWLLGKGGSSFFAISLYRQKMAGFHLNDGYDLWLHCDPLQFVFEYGLLMLFPLAVIVMHVLQFSNKREIVSLAAISAGSLFYYPFHWPVILLSVFLMLKLAHDTFNSSSTKPIAWDAFGPTF